MNRKSHEEPKELPTKVDYSKLPKDIANMVAGNERAIIEKESTITVSNKGEYIIRIPKQIVEDYPITAEQKIRFKLTKPKPNTDEKPILVISIN
jgi:dihydroneopterin aldolase